MKKILSLILSCTLCAATLSAVGCKQKTPELNVQTSASLEMGSENLLLTLGEKAELPVSYNPIDGTVLAWSSSAPNVVSVDGNGFVEAVGVGVATITAHYGNEQASCTIEVGLSGNVPLLMFESNIGEEITLLKGTSFDLETFVSFNGKAYQDAEVEYYVADPAVGTMVDNQFVAGQTTGSTQVSVFATWRGQTVHAKTVTINVISESTVLLNDGKLVAVHLYTVQEHESVSYATEQVISSVFISEDNNEITEYSLSVLDEAIAEIEASGDEWIVRSKKAGKTKLLVSYGAYEVAFDVLVDRPVANIDKTVEYSSMDGMYVEKGSTVMRPVVEAVDALEEFVAYEFKGKEYKARNGALELPNGENEVVLYNEKVGYRMVFDTYTMLIDELSDFTKIYAGTTKQTVEGIFVLLKDIIEPDTVLSMPTGMVANNFGGTFDGRGHTLSFTLDHGVEQAFGLFGNTFEGATIKNLALHNVKQTGTSGKNPAGILAANGSADAGMPEYVLENLSIDVSFIGESQVYIALLGNVMWSAIMRNVIVHVPEVPEGQEYGSFARGDCLSVSGAYVVSPALRYVITQDPPDQSKWLHLPERYDTYDEMISAGNNYSSFSPEYWDVTTYGIPVWKTLVSDFVE